MAAIKVDKEEEVASYHQIHSQLHRHKEEVRGFITKPEYALPFLQPGRLVSGGELESQEDSNLAFQVRVRDGTTDWGWGVVFNFQKKAVGDKNNPTLTGKAFVYYVDALLHCSECPPILCSLSMPHTFPI